MKPALLPDVPKGWLDGEMPSACYRDAEWRMNSMADLLVRKFLSGRPVAKVRWPTR